VTYPIELPEVSRFISIAERLSGDTGSANSANSSMIVDQLTTSAGLKPAA